MRAKVLILDNYDSFTYNLAQYLEEMGADVIVYRNDELSVGRVRRLGASHIVVSPGPGRPEGAGISCELISEYAGDIPILGVCLGHQAIGLVMGGRVVRGPFPVHGKTSSIYHDSKTIYEGIPSPLEATRYHSLVVDASSIPECLEVSGTTDGGLVMSIRHRELPLEGVQFHPESILTENGREVLSNFLRISG